MIPEREYWTKFLNKKVTLQKINYFYTGIIIEVLANKLVLDDRKEGEIILSFDGLSLIRSEDTKWT